MQEEYYEEPNVDGIVKAVKILGTVTITAALAFAGYKGYIYYKNKMIEKNNMDKEEPTKKEEVINVEPTMTIVNTKPDIQINEGEDSDKPIDNKAVDYSNFARAVKPLGEELEKTTKNFRNMGKPEDHIDDEGFEPEPLDPNDIFPWNIYKNQAVVTEEEETQKIIFNTREELSKMRYEAGSMEAMRQYIAYVLSEVVDNTDDSVYRELEMLMAQPIYLNKIREENTIMNLREQRMDFFGEDAPERVLAEATFAELLILLAKRVQYDWDQNSLFVIINRMLVNIDWWNARDMYGEDEYIEMVVNNTLDEDNFSDQYGIGLFGLPEIYIPNFGNPETFSFLDQYAGSNLGEK